MFCSKCGCRNADGAAFCQNCGTKLVTVNAQPDPQQPTAQPTYQQPTVQPTYQQPTYQQPTYQQPTYARPQKNPVGLAVLKRVCSSPVALVAIIAYTAAAVFNVISSFINGAATVFLFRLTYEDASSDYVAQAAADAALLRITVISVLISVTFAVLIVVGLWITYGSAASRYHTEMKTSGLTIVKVTLIVELVFACIALGFVEIVLLLAIVALAGDSATYEFDDFINDASTDMAIFSLVLYAIIIAVVMTLMIIFYVKAVKSINTITMTALTGNPSANVSTFVAVMSFILGGFAVISVVRNAIYQNVNVTAALLGICSATAYIAFGIFLFSYRSQMRTAVFGGEYTGMMQQQPFDDSASFAFDPQVQTASGQQNTSEPQNVVTGQPTAAPNAEPRQDDSQQDEL